MPKKPSKPSIAPKELACPRCKVTMDAGFVLDRQHYGMPSETQWAPGTAERSVWSGLKLAGKKLLPVVTFRCPQCGLLQSYAG